MGLWRPEVPGSAQPTQALVLDRPGSASRARTPPGGPWARSGGEPGARPLPPRGGVAAARGGLPASQAPAPPPLGGQPGAAGRGCGSGGGRTLPAAGLARAAGAGLRRPLMEGGAPAGERRRRGHHGEQADHLHRRAAGQLPGEPGCPGPRSGAPRPLPSFPVACRGLPKASSRGSNLASALRSTRDLGPVTSPSEPQFPHPRNESAFQLEDSSVLCSFLSLSHSDYLLLAASRTRTPPPQPLIPAPTLAQRWSHYT